MIEFQLLTETVEPFYEKYGCSQSVLDVDKCRQFRNRDGDEDICLHRFSPRIKNIYCVMTMTTDHNEIAIHKFDEELETWHELKTIQLDILDISDVSGCPRAFYANDKIYLFGEIRIDEAHGNRVKVRFFVKFQSRKSNYNLLFSF